MAYSIDEIFQFINWENYKNDDGSYWKLQEVLYAKLEYLLSEKEDLEEEHIETIELVQNIISLLTEEQIKLLFNHKL